MGQMRVCTICRHKDREAIDRALIEKQPLRAIATQFSVSHSAVDRHRQRHLAELVRAAASDRMDTVQSELQRARGRAETLYGAAEAVLRAAVEARDPRAALQAVRTACGVLAEARALAELRGEHEAQQERSPETKAVERQVCELLAERDARVRSEARAELLAELGLPAPSAEVQGLIQ